MASKSLSSSSSKTVPARSATWNTGPSETSEKQPLLDLPWTVVRERLLTLSKCSITGGTMTSISGSQQSGVQTLSSSLTPLQCFQILASIGESLSLQKGSQVITISVLLTSTPRTRSKRSSKSQPASGSE